MRPCLLIPKFAKPGLLLLLWGLVAFQLESLGANCISPPSGLSGWWSGDGNANDSIGANNGVLLGGAAANTSGLIGQCFSFDGASGYVQITDTPALRPPNLTIETWVRFNSLDSSRIAAPAGDQYLVFKQNSHQFYFEGYDLSKTRIGGVDVFRFEIGSASGVEVEIDSVTPLTTGVWYHVAAVRGSNYMQLYVNGQLERQTNVNFPQDYGSLPLFFGTTGSTYWDAHLNGNLDEVSLYNRALTSNEIASIYGANSAGKCHPASIVAQPLNQNATVGSNIAFSVTAIGTSPLHYQWNFNGAALVDGSHVSGSSSSTLILSNIQSADAGAYSALVTNSVNAVTSSVAILTVNVPAAPQVANLTATSIRANQATLNGQIISPGSDTPMVTIYYGITDGGTNDLDWESNVNIGPQYGPFSQTISGLASNTVYYYAAKATNSIGATWATPSASFATLATNPPSASVAVLTHHNDLSRTGSNPSEKNLNIRNVNTNQFGLLYTLPVDDQVYAQPLVMTNVGIPGKGSRNLLLVATVNDSVYAFDADDSGATNAYWQTSFLGPNVVAPSTDDIPNTPCHTFRNISGNFGIIGTPVIDPATETFYVVARTKEFATNFVQKLHALDIKTGTERPGSPVAINATYPGTGTGSISGVLTFDPLRENQRPALALVGGIVYIGWASHCDWNPYHGWLIGYDATTLQRVVVYNTSPNGEKAGIWMSGGAPAADTNGNLYLSVGNGTVGSSGNPRDLTNRGESFLKLSIAGTNISVTSWFTPFNWPNLEASDLDLGSAEVLLIPRTTLAFSGSKQGLVYLVNRDNMGGLSSSGADTNIVQSIAVSSGNIHGGTIWWDGPDDSYAYVQGEVDYLRQYKFDRNAGLFQVPDYAHSPTPAPSGMPGGMLAVSSDTTNAGTGILWASHPLNADANGAVVAGILRAYNAQNVAEELWNSEQSNYRDSVGNFAKYCPPTVANGKVFLATFSNRINVYGLLPLPLLDIKLSGNGVQLSWATNVNYTYQLQSSTNLASGLWKDLTNSATISNDLFQISIPTSNFPTFYRLKR